MTLTPRCFTTALLSATLAAGLLLVGPNAVMAELEPNPPSSNEESSPPSTSYQNYSGLADLISMICDDARERFQDFYGPSLVTVEPFSTIGFFERHKQSELGVTLADQMIAIINNDTQDGKGRARGKTPQRLNGVLQEVDGYLRVHISGVNAAGQRTSYVVSVEMSEPIYRALHTYL